MGSSRNGRTRWAGAVRDVFFERRGFFRGVGFLRVGFEARAVTEVPLLERHQSGAQGSIFLEAGETDDWGAPREVE